MKYYLGLEFGSTRIKSVIIGDNAVPVAVGGYSWENQYEGGYWTYTREEILRGMQESFRLVKADFETKTGEKLTNLDGIGISAMMHGYVPLDGNSELLVPFRTWRNTTASEAADKLTEAFGFHIPARWSIAHLYQAVLEKEPHVGNIRHLHTLASYIHFLLTGENVIGVGDGSGMFPIRGGDYNDEYMNIFRTLFHEAGYAGDPAEFFPKVLSAGEYAGRLTEAGAKLLDVSGELTSGIPLCPPEGDAGTGMVCTNSVAPGTANVSAGTSCFLMAVLENDFVTSDPTVDMVVTPDGYPVAMIHANNCTSEINRWEHFCEEVATLTGGSTAGLFDKLFQVSENSTEDIGGLLAYPFVSAEPIAHPLGIGGKGAPARLVFGGIQGDGIAVSMVDMGDRFRLVAAKIALTEQPEPMPHLPVARVMWKILPDFATGTEAWIRAGGAHHAVVSTALTVEDIRLFAELTGTELVTIGF